MLLYIFMEGNTYGNGCPFSLNTLNFEGSFQGVCPFKHPAYRFLLADLAQVDLSRFQILMSQYYLGNNF